MFRTLFIFVASILTTIEALRCWKCENAPSNDDCLLDGTIEECRPNQGSCQNTVRLDNGNIRIDKRCKQTVACRNNMQQNDAGAWHPVQCNMYGKNAVCRCCCEGEKCNSEALWCRGTTTDPVPPDLFTIMDINKDGLHSRVEIYNMLDSALKPKSDEVLAALLEEFDTNSDGGVSQSEFRFKVASDVNTRVWDTLRPSPDGKIVELTLENYQHMMKNFGLDLTTGLARKMHERADLNTDNVISGLREFNMLSFTGDTVELIMDEFYKKEYDAAKTISTIMLKTPVCENHGCTVEILGCGSANLKKHEVFKHCTLCECQEYEAICERNPCQNGGHCISADDMRRDLNIDSPDVDFYCKCEKGYYGEFCELFEGIKACQQEYDMTEMFYRMYPGAPGGPDYPRCEADGTFSRKQCTGNETEFQQGLIDAVSCWCAFPETGSETMGTRKEGTAAVELNCEGICTDHGCTADACEEPTCLACDSGRLDVDEIGCTKCECYVERSACDDNPCLNGGTCMNTDPDDLSSFFCGCPTGFFGTYCEF